MAKICADYMQAEELRKHGFSEDTTNMFCTEDGGASNFPICSADGEVYYRRTWSLGALLEMLPDSISDDKGIWVLSITKKAIEYKHKLFPNIVKVGSSHGDMVDDACFVLCQLAACGYLNR